MGKASDLPMALWKANFDLQTRLGRLLQDSGRDWLELGTRAAGEGAAEFDAEARRLLQAGDWQALAALPIETFWRQAEQRVGDGQAFAQVALQAQERFARELGTALQEWQRQMAEAWSSAGLDGSAAQDTAQAWRALLAGLEQSFAGMATGGGSGKGPGTRGG